MEISEREKRILQAVVDAYIDTAEPVGSKSLLERIHLGFSSATIRNEMFDLEEKGYLDKPHASSGRVPSQSAYRLYVDSLMDAYLPTRRERKYLEAVKRVRWSELDKFISDVSHIIAKLSTYPTVTVTPRLSAKFIQQFEIIAINPNTFLLVMVTSAGRVKNRIFRLGQGVSPRTLARLVKLLNERLARTETETITEDVFRSMESEMEEQAFVLRSVLQVIQETLQEIDDADVRLEGSSSILGHPEYKDLDKARDLLDFLEQKEEIVRLVEVFAPTGDQRISVVIGRESQVDQLEDSSLVLANYRAGRRVLGTIGVLGPMRMNYAKVISHMELCIKCIDAVLAESFISSNTDGGNSTS